MNSLLMTEKVKTENQHASPFSLKKRETLRRTRGTIPNFLTRIVHFTKKYLKKTPNRPQLASLRKMQVL
jgi:hypothetical protein